MLSGTSGGLVEMPMLFVPPPLAEIGGEWIPLPACVDIFPTYEDNFRLYRILVAHQAGRLLFWDLRLRAVGTVGILSPLCPHPA